ncbi:MAG: nitroreductase family protein [Bacillota bacterium]
MDELEAIKKRISVRSYDSRPLSESVRSELDGFCMSVSSGPFGNMVRFQLLDLEPLSSKDLRRLGTYGVIKGAHLYLLGAVIEGSGKFEDFGYCMEKVILKATALGLGTCWLAGTFKRSAFASKMELAKDELLPAIAPLGYPAKELSTMGRMFQYGANSKKRRPWSELFFEENGITPLAEEDTGDYREALDAVRIGPSASNRQPWRILKDNNGIFHLYLKENRIYNRILGKIRIQNIDMGIAMCHFEIAAREYDRAGRWKKYSPAPEISGLQYIASWSKK